MDENIKTPVVDPEQARQAKRESITSIIASKIDHDIEKLKIEKTFRKLEDEWIKKRDKVG